MKAIIIYHEGRNFFLYANVQLEKRDIVTTVIYYYTMTNFHYAKRDSRLSAYGGVDIEVSYFYYKNIKNLKISTKMSINVDITPPYTER